jgi:hypothetical protein
MLGAKPMSEFLASMYQIKRAGRHVTEGLFTTADEIFDHIRCHRAGVYSVYRQLPPGADAGRETEFWGDVAHFGAGKIAFDPTVTRG